MIDTIFFDLDGTLLLMDQDQFIANYFASLSKKFKRFGKEFMTAVELGVLAMLKNDGKETNEKVFWNAFHKAFPIKEKLEDEFFAFYKNEFQDLKNFTSQHQNAKEVITMLKEKGYDLVLSTNPLFPQIATYSRIYWAGIEPGDFKWITTYENSHYSKPNLKYYQEVMAITNKKPHQILMVGNDVIEDLCVHELKIKTFLVEDNLINHQNLKIKADYRGSFNDFYQYVYNLPRKE